MLQAEQLQVSSLEGCQEVGAGGGVHGQCGEDNRGIWGYRIRYKENGGPGNLKIFKIQVLNGEFWGYFKT